LGICQAETLELINVKTCTIDYVGEGTQQKWLESVDCGCPHRTVKYNLKDFSYFTLPYLILPFSLYASAVQTARPFCPLDSSNDAVCCKEVPFGDRIDTRLHSGVKTPNISNFATGKKNFQPNQYTR
jgi:hypothetical protein